MATYIGTSRDDYLTAYADGDELVGQGGADVFTTNGAWFRADGGLGNDIYYVFSALTTITEWSWGGGDTVFLYLSAAYTLPENVENLHFSSEDSTDGDGNALDNEMIGNGAANALHGHDGNDVLRGRGGGDRLEGGSGDDFLDPGGGAAAVTTGTGRDIVYVNKEVVEGHYVVSDFDPEADGLQVRGFWDYTLSAEGADTLVTFSPYVTVRLENVAAASLATLNFEIAPRPDEHTFVGTDGVESVYGWADGDLCYGLDGGDYFGDHDDDWSIFHGGKGNDTFEVNNVLDQVIEAEREGRDLVSLYLAGDYRLSDHVEAINLHVAANVTGNAEGNAIQGSGGDDVLVGLDGDDVLRAQFGADRLDGGNGNDFLDGGLGESTLVLGAGSDTVFVDWESGSHVVQDFAVAEDRLEVWTFTGLESLTQFGDDTLVVFRSGYPDNPEAMTSVLLVGVGVDQLASGNFLFVRDGTSASDRLAGGVYSDDLNGGGGQDLVAGQRGDDELTGGAGSDVLLGGTGGDVLRGGGGDDVITGNSGRDVMNGGAGADRFVFRAITDSRNAAIDRLYGFDAAAGDLIDLRAIDADAGQQGDQAFAFASAFSGTSGEAVLSYDAARNWTTILLDVDGNARADFSLMVHGAVSADAGWGL